MSMDFDAMTAAVRDAENTIALADKAAERLAKLLVGRLRKVDNGWLLAKLKRELADFDAHRKVWREDK